MAINSTRIPYTARGEVAVLLYKIIKNESSVDNTHDMGYYDTQPQEPFSGLYIAWLCVAGIILIPGVLANGMIILCLFKFDKLRVASNYLIGSLAVADLMMMAIMVSFVLSDVFQLDIPLYLWPSLDIMVGSASINNLAGVSFDRAAAVMRPLHYHNTINTKQAAKAIKCIWIYSLTIFIFAFLREVIESEVYHLTILYIAYFFGYFVPCVVILISYTLIVLATIKNVKLSRSIEKAVYNAAASLNDDLSLSRSRTRKLRMQEIKIAGNFMVILLPFVAGWGFFFCTSFYELIVGHHIKTQLYEWFLLIVPWVSSSINPIVYIISTSALRNACFKILCRGKSLARAKESLMTTLQSKRNSAAERRASQTSDDKIPFLERFNLLNFIKRAKPSPDTEAGLNKITEVNEMVEDAQKQHDERKCDKMEIPNIDCLLICHPIPKAIDSTAVKEKLYESGL